jgi:protein SCO1/2
MKAAVTTRFAGRHPKSRLAMMGALIASLALALAPARAHAQVAPIGEKSMGDPAASKLPVILQRATIEQHLNQELPLAADFRDETGRTIHLGDYFGQRPAILALVYYRCPMLCSEELNGLVGALEMLKFTPGKDFDVIVASFDPSEGPALAASEKATYLKRYGRMNTANGWHFLTGPQASINALIKAAGFGYVSVPGPDGKMNQFAHASSIELITTEGRISQYYLGVEYSARDMRAGLVEASHGQIGSPVDLIYTYCYRYDPHAARNSMLVVRIVQLGCLLTVLALGAFILISLRQDALNGGNAGAAKKANG